MNNQQEKTLLPTALKVELKKLAHHLKPVVQIGKKGLTDSLIREIESALVAHELIKVHFLPRQKEAIETDLSTIIAQTNSSHIDTIGNIVILFRKRETDSQF